MDMLVINNGEKDPYLLHGNRAAIGKFCMRNHSLTLNWGRVFWFELKQDMSC